MSLVVNKGWIHGKLRYFQDILWNSIKLSNEVRWEIKDFDIFIKIIWNEIHGNKNHRIWMKICDEIDKQSLERNSDHKEKENENWK